jgi:hypothetical protein
MTTEPTPQPAHHVTFEDASGWRYWRCHDCDWHTAPSMYSQPWDGPAAARHAAGSDREDDP